MSFLQGGSLYYSRHIAHRGVADLRQNADVEPETAFFSLLSAGLSHHDHHPRRVVSFLYRLVRLGDLVEVLVARWSDLPRMPAIAQSIADGAGFCL
jgi:hypothetical protein